MRDAELDGAILSMGYLPDPVKATSRISIWRGSLSITPWRSGPWGPREV